MSTETAKPLVFGAEKRGNKLDHFIWSCTRAYPVKHAFSLGDGNPLPNELDTSQAKAMLKKVADFGADNIFFSGGGWTGEPLMRKDILELVRYSGELKLGAYVKVTGWHFNAAVAETLAAADAKAIICLAGNRETDAKLRGKGAFEDSLNAAKLCKQHSVPFAISIINTRHVAKQVRELVELSIDVGARGFHLASLIPQPIQVEDQFHVLGPLEPTAQEREDQLEEIYELNKTVGRQILIVPYEMFNNRLLKTKEPARQLRSPCSMCDNLTRYEWLEVLDDGKAYACAPLGLAFGDIRTDGIAEIMDRMRASKELMKLADRSNLKGKCGVCEFKGICGGCRARAYIMTGNSLNQDPACPYRPNRWQPVKQREDN